MSTFKRAKVVMLPTKNKSNIYKNDQGIKTHNKHPNFGRLGWKPQHIYVTTDDKPRGWCYCEMLNEIHIVTNLDVDKGLNLESYRKIVATTDKTLRKPSGEMYPEWDYLPEPSEGFIEKFTRKKGGIDEVMIEYELVGETGKKVFYTLKVTSDNTITIKAVKNSWNREELKVLLEQFLFDNTIIEPEDIKETTTNWIKEKL